MFGENWEHQEKEFEEAVKDQVKVALRVEQQEEHLTKVQTLAKQGDFLYMASCEGGDAIWKSFIYNLKQGTMKFYLNAVTNTLPTGNNLLQWGKSTNDQCKLCKGRETTCHVLNNCKVALDQGKYTWRHDNILSYIATILDHTKYRFYVDIPNHMTTTGGTIPVELCVTPLRPDIVIVDDKKKTMDIFELTCPLEPNIKKRHTEKSDKYAHFNGDLDQHTTKVTCFEIGSRGYISPDNHERLKSLHKFCKPNTKLKKFKENISALSIYSSYAIFIGRKEPQWMKPGTMKPPFSE
jgi:hypothetical protein